MRRLYKKLALPLILSLAITPICVNADTDVKTQSVSTEEQDKKVETKEKEPEEKSENNKEEEKSEEKTEKEEKKEEKATEEKQESNSEEHKTEQNSEEKNTQEKEEKPSTEKQTSTESAKTSESSSQKTSTEKKSSETTTKKKENTEKSAEKKNSEKRKNTKNGTEKIKESSESFKEETQKSTEASTENKTPSTEEQHTKKAKKKKVIKQEGNKDIKNQTADDVNEQEDGKEHGTIIERVENDGSYMQNEIEYVAGFVYFCQGDDAWNHNGYHIAGAGCGPTSMAVVISSLTDKYVTPVETTKWAYEHGLYSSAGSQHRLIPDISQAYELKCEGVGRDKNKIIEALKAGHPVVALMGPGYFTRGGHFMVLVKIDAEENVTVADVGSRKRTQFTYKLDDIISQSKNAQADGPFWIISNEKKEEALKAEQERAEIEEKEKEEERISHDFAVKKIKSEVNKRSNLAIFTTEKKPEAKIVELRVEEIDNSFGGLRTKTKVMKAIDIVDPDEDNIAKEESLATGPVEEKEKVIPKGSVKTPQPLKTFNMFR